MSNSTYLSGKYKGVPYDKKRVWENEILDNSYIFDVSRGCAFISRRTIHSMRDVVGKSVYDIMSREGAEEMLAHLMSYTDVLMFVKTSLGPAIAVPSLVPSSSLGILVFDVMSTDDVLRAARANKMRVVFSRELVKGKRIRSTRSSLENAGRSELLISRIYEVFGGAHSEQLVSGDITSRVEEKIYAISYYVGCPVGVVCNVPIIAMGDFDFSLFVAFITVALTCAREISPLREAAIVIENNDYGLSVRVSIAAKGVTKGKIKALEDFRRIAHRRRMLYECLFDSDVIHVRFSPIAKDWSLLGIKSSDCDEEV